MNYEDYIKLGFKRIDIQDQVNFKKYGYDGFRLERKITNWVTAVVHFDTFEKIELMLTVEAKTGTVKYMEISMQTLKQLIK
jgi:hypothetical protein